MTESKVRALISFRARDSEAGDPAETLSDVLAMLVRLGCERLDFTLLIDPEALLIHLMADFGHDGAGKPDLCRIALVRAEGEGGFEATFPTETPATPDWIVAMPYLNAPTLPTGEPFALPLPMVGGLPDLLRRMRLTAAGYGYQLAAVRQPGSRDTARKLVRALAASEARGGPAAAAAEALRAAISLVREDGWNVREGLCLRLSDADRLADLIEEQLVEDAQKSYRFLPEETLGVDWAPLEVAAEAPPGAKSDWARAINDRRELGYPTGAIVVALEAARRDGIPRRPSPPRPPPPPGGPGGPFPPPTGPFAFLSYAHRDRPHLQGLIQALARHGLPIWFDEHIHGGAAWDAYLEDHIRQCVLMIACVSEAYEQSRYCRREIKFADLIEKPILPVAAQSYNWGPGLTMMFQELQIIRIAGQTAAETVASHALRLAPALARAEAP